MKKKVLFIHGIDTEEIPYDVAGINVSWSNSWRTIISKSIEIDDLEVYNYKPFQNVPKSDFIYNYNFLNPNFSPLLLDNPNGNAIVNYLLTDLKNIIDYFFSQTESKLEATYLLDSTDILTRKPVNFQDKTQAQFGMEIQWLLHDQLKDQISKDLIGKLREINPDIVFSHSMGSFVSYYTFLKNQPNISDLLDKITFITFGSQISYDFLMKYVWKRKKLPVLTRKWLNIWNDRDRFFNSSIDDVIPNYESYRFKQLNVSFGLKNPKNFNEIKNSFGHQINDFHDARKYLSYLVNDPESIDFIN